MPFIDILLPEYDRETETTRRVLERVPESAFEWKPHERSMTLGALAVHVAALPTWTANVMNADSFDIADEPTNHYAQPASATDLLSTFDENVASARTLLLNRSDGEFNQSWTLTTGDAGRLHASADRHAAVLRPEPPHPSPRTIERLSAPAEYRGAGDVRPVGR